VSESEKGRKEVRTAMAGAAVIGAGLMGHGIAQVFAENGCSVGLYDVDDGALQRAIDNIRSNLSLIVESGMEPTDYPNRVLSRIRATTDMGEAVRGAWFVTEAVPEDLNLKRRLFREVEEAIGADAILASNTSTLSIEEIADSVEKPDRLIITHWFNPPHLVPVVEVAPGRRTSSVTTATTLNFLSQMGKEPVQVRKPVPGFIVNRIQTAMFREVVALLEEGVATAEDIDRAARGSFGLRLALMGPLTVVDFGGVDLWHKGAQNLYPLLDASSSPRKIWTAMVEEGRLGARTGKGFFQYDPAAIPAIVKARDLKLLALLRVLYPKRGEGD
jgi:3-hydroxybutyryl-CoA dehydrogenase